LDLFSISRLPNPERADEMQISPKLIIPPGLFDACLSNELFVTERTPTKKCDEQIWNSIVIMH
jgi:hypothetical protein